MKSKIVLGSELKPGDIVVAASVLFLLVQVTKDSYLKALEINQKASFYITSIIQKVSTEFWYVHDHIKNPRFKTWRCYLCSGMVLHCFVLQNNF
jgi:hypothetical protein